MIEHVSVDDVMALDPCSDYPRERVADLWGGRPTLDWLEVCRLPIPEHDRVWLISRVLDDKTARLFAVACARAALESERKAGREPDARSWAAVDCAEQYAHGLATEEELSAAISAARSAARSAELAAAESAESAAESAWSEWSSARSAMSAWSSARSARSAAISAAMSSAMSAAESAWSARSANISLLVDLLLCGGA